VEFRKLQKYYNSKQGLKRYFSHSFIVASDFIYSILYEKIELKTSTEIHKKTVTRKELPKRLKITKTPFSSTSSPTRLHSLFQRIQWPRLSYKMAAAGVILSALLAPPCARTNSTRNSPRKVGEQRTRSPRPGSLHGGQWPRRRSCPSWARRWWCPSRPW
jgi:hypothetical protein